MEDWKQKLSRHQTLDSLLFVNYTERKRIKSRTLLELRVRLYLIVVLMRILLYLTAKQALLVERFQMRVSQLKVNVQAEKKWHR